MNFDTIITILVASTSLLLGLFVLASGVKNISNRLFFAFNLSAAVWICSSLAAKFSTIDTVQPFINIGFAAAALLVYFFLMFCMVFPNNPSSFRKWWLILLFPPVIFVILSYMNLVAIPIQTEGSGFKVSSAAFYLPYTALLLVYIIASIWKLIVNYRQEKGVTKDQIFYVLLGSSIYAFLALFFSLVMPLFTAYQDIYKWGIYSVIVFLVITSYAIIERGFLNIKVILTEAAVMIVLLALLVQLLLSESLNRGLLNGLILVAFAYGGYLVIVSVKKEIAHNKQLRHFTNQLEQDKKELVDLDRMKDEFLQMATHELNTPITVIQGKLDMAIREDYVHLNKEQKDYFETVMTDTERLAHLSKDILNVARIDQHRLTINRSETDLDQLITSIVEGLQIKAKDKGITVEYIKPEKPLPKMMVDQNKIGEVVTNLVNNAIKFTSKGGITVEAKDEGGNIVVSVKDTGVGIEKEGQKHLFEKFYQVGRFDPNNPQEQQGSGLGLYISKNIIEIHGGKIWLESEKDKGSSFYFSLPKEYKEIKVENGKLHCSEDQVRVL